IRREILHEILGSVRQSVVDQVVPTGRVGRIGYVGKLDIVVPKMTWSARAKLRQIVVIRAGRRIESHHSVGSDVYPRPRFAFIPAGLIALPESEFDIRRD